MTKRRLSDKEYEVLRRRAIELWDEKSWTQEKISEALGVDQGTVSRWLRKFRQGGLVAIKNQPSQVLTDSPTSNPTVAVEDYEKMEDVSIWMVIQPDVMPRGGRKFIVDIGQVEKSRLSIYLDEKNDLCFRVIDDYGEVHTAKLPRKSMYISTASPY